MMRKVLVIGWDAADWKVTNALIEQGRMPHTAALIERGVMGDLATLHPVLSPMLWTSLGMTRRIFSFCTSLRRILFMTLRLPCFDTLTPLPTQSHAI